ncbi:HK97 gp10 family phage protein [Salipiger sp. H15]|uniref:HK97 gp10 family phage protein n=1 Tax=Alloyangia sp. H15 TaxID=3029062 RepID=A0AAU8ANH2_9RHOB
MTGLVSLKCFSDLEKQLEKLGKSAGRAALRRAGISALEPMARIARSLAPEETGELIESIEVSAKAKGAGAEIGRAEFHQVMKGGGTRVEALTAMRGARRAAKIAGGYSHVELFMGPEKARSKNEAIKAFVQEFGSAHVAATPYMRPAWDQDHQQLLARLKRELWFEVSSAMARAEGAR